MKSTLIRVLCLLLPLLLILPLAACGTGEETETNAASDTDAPGEESEAPDETLDLPDLDYEGKAFRVLTTDFEGLYTLLDVEEGNTGEAVNDAIYSRNRIIEDRLGIRFEVENLYWTGISDVLRRQVQAGYSEGDSYDLVILVQREAYNNTLAGLLYNTDKLEYMDTDKAYYFRSINEACSFGGYPFFAYGADSVNLLGWSTGLIYNKEIADNIHAGNLYETVRAGEWTHERLFTLAETAAADLDGDGRLTPGKDRLGMIGNLNRSVSTTWQCSGEYLIIKDGDGMPVYNANGNQRMIEIMQNALDHYSQPAYNVLTTTGGNLGQFMEGKAMFISTIIGELYDIRSMETDYGVLPFPKYDMNQPAYVSRSGEGLLHCAPATCHDTELTGAVLQALAYYSYKTVYDAYYKQALSTKFLRDPDSVEMLKLILDTLTVDIGDSIWYDDISTPLLAAISTNGGRTGLGSLYKKFEKPAERQIKEARKFLEKVGNDG